MQQSPRYNFRYPELTDQISAFPPDVAAQNALLLDQVIGSLTDTTTEALAGKAPTSHTHTMGQVAGLDTALAGKAPTSHTHTMGQVAGLDTALAGKAPTSHTHTMGQVAGLDTALAGKADRTTLDTRVPSNMALRLDTSAGVRVFAGNTMIYGDTGWRKLDASYLINGWDMGELPYFFIRRTGDTVTMSIPSFSIIGTNATGGVFMNLPDGFSTYTGGNYGMVGVISSGDVLVALEKNFDGLAATGRGLLSGQVSWITLSSWPTMLPGIPF